MRLRGPKRWRAAAKPVRFAIEPPGENSGFTRVVHCLRDPAKNCQLEGSETGGAQPAAYERVHASPEHLSQKAEEAARHRNIGVKARVIHPSHGLHDALEKEVETRFSAQAFFGQRLVDEGRQLLRATSFPDSALRQPLLIVQKAIERQMGEPALFFGVGIQALSRSRSRRLGQRAQNVDSPRAKLSSRASGVSALMNCTNMPGPVLVAVGSDRMTVA